MKTCHKKKKKAEEREGAEKPKRKAAEAAGFGYTDIIEATQDV